MWINGGARSKNPTRICLFGPLRATRKRYRPLQDGYEEYGAKHLASLHYRRDRTYILYSTVKFLLILLAKSRAAPY